MSDVETQGPAETQQPAGTAVREAKKFADKVVVEHSGPVGDDTPILHDNDDADAQEDTEEAATSDGEHAPEKRLKKPLKERMSELTQKRKDAERRADEKAAEAEYWRKEALRRQAQAEPAPQTQVAQHQVDEDREPDITDDGFDFDQKKWLRAWSAWDKRQDQKKAAVEKAQEEAQARQRTFQERESVFIAAHPDYEEVAKAPHVPITQQMAEILYESDAAPAIAYYLGQHLDEATTIAQMSPIGMARAIGRIEASLSAQSVEPKPVSSPKTVTRAPAPVTTLNGAPAVKKDVDDMSQLEYEQSRRVERKARGLR